MAFQRRDVLAVAGLGLVGGGLTGAFAGAPSAGAPPATYGLPSVDGYGPLYPAGPELAGPSGLQVQEVAEAGPSNDCIGGGFDKDAAELSL